MLWFFGTSGVINQGTLVFNRSDSLTYAGRIVDGATPGAIVQYGSGTTTLTGALTNSGPTTVSNGTLVVARVVAGVATNGGNVNVSGGTLVVGNLAGTVIASNAILGSLNLNSGTIVAFLNTSVPQSNTVYSVKGSLTALAGAKLRLLNTGPSLHVGDRFQIFNQAVGGASLALVSPGYTFTSNGDGSYTVASVLPSGTLTAAFSGGNLNLSWPAGYAGLYLQVQTNTVAQGLGTNWVTIPGTDAATVYSAPTSGTNVLFYRLAP
jgi:autotransporter-associated beta strand protein